MFSLQSARLQPQAKILWTTFSRSPNNAVVARLQDSTSPNLQNNFSQCPQTLFSLQSAPLQSQAPVCEQDNLITQVETDLSEHDAVVHVGVDWGQPGRNHLRVGRAGSHTAGTVLSHHTAAAALRDVLA